MNPEKNVRPKTVIRALAGIALLSLAASQVSPPEKNGQLEYKYSAESSAVLVAINNELPGRYYGDRSLLNNLDEADKLEAIKNINIAYNQMEISYKKWLQDGSKARALVDLWMQESRWQQDADNESSDAYGIPQAMLSEQNIKAGYFLGYGDYVNSAETQIAWGLYYISEKYNNPISALDHWKLNGWY